VRKSIRIALDLVPGVALGALLAAGCGSGPAQPSAGPDIRGTYAGGAAWETSIISPADATTATTETHACAGSITIDSQSGATFSGRFSMDGQSTHCSGSGTIAGGTANPDGRISFALPGAPLPNTYTEQWSEECAVTSDSGVYSGAVDGSTLEATRNLRYDCPRAGMVAVSVSFVGRK
jgi:hypothetical protein